MEEHSGVQFPICNRTAEDRHRSEPEVTQSMRATNMVNDAVLPQKIDVALWPRAPTGMPPVLSSPKRRGGWH